MAPTYKKSGKIVGPSTGAAVTGVANVPGTPTFVSHGTGSITITFSENSNSEVVTYAIYCNELSKYAGSDKVVDEAAEVWQTFSAWGTITLTGFSDYTSYTFKVKARDEATVPTAFSASSVGMCTDPGVDYGPTSENLSREVTGGNTIVDTTAGVAITGTAVADSEATQSTLTEYYGNITATYTLKNNSSTTSRIVAQYSENGTDWSTATDAGGDSDGLTGLTTSPTGVEHVFIWDSYTDSGTSELDTSVYLRITPYDASPTGGDAAAAVSSDAFAVNNRPAIIAWINADGYTFDKDTTPIFMATMPLLRGGTVGFPALHVYEEDGTTLVMDRYSVEDITGWEYETALNTWAAVTFAGIPTAKINNSLRCRYTVQAADALTADKVYLINGEMGENRDRG